MNIKKQLIFLLGFLVLLSSFGASVEMLNNVTTANTTFPIYNKGKLQAILFGGQVGRSGNLIIVNDPVIDLAKKNVDVNLIKVGKVNAYNINDKLTEIVAFWQARILFSDGFAMSSTAEIDQKSSQAFGAEKVFFRSPALDIDGIGYHVNYKASTCLIRSDVKIVARTGANDVRKIIENGKAPEKFEFIEAKADELFIDLRKNYIVLTNNVELKQAQGTIICDKMTIFLDDTAKSSDSEIGMGNSSAKISEVICTGNVKVIQDKSNAIDGVGGDTFNFFGYLDESNSDDLEMVYCAKEKHIIKIDTTTVGADNLKWNFNENKISFTGNVVLKDRDADLNCDNLEIQLDKLNGKTAIKNIVCLGDVKLVNSDNELLCEKLTLLFANSNKKSELDRAIAIGNMKIIQYNADKTISTLSANIGVLHIRENRAEFLENVNVNNQDVIIDSDKLEIIAKEIANKNIPFPETKKGEAPSRIKINNDLELDKVIASKNVVIERKSQGDEPEKAYGDKASYIVSDKKIYLVGSPKVTPIIKKGKNILRARKDGKVVVDLNEESAYIENGADLEIRDRSNFNM